MARRTKNNTASGKQKTTSGKSKTTTKASSRQFSLGILFGLVIILLFLVILLFNKAAIESLIRPEGTTENGTSREDTLIVEEEPLPQDSDSSVEIQAENSSGNNAPKTGEGEKDESFVVEKTAEPPAEQTESAAPEDPPEAQEQTLRARLFFVQVNDQGYIQLKSIIRTVPAGDAPLTAAVQALLEGPDTREMNRGLLNLIPEDSQLLSARVTDGTAYLNFNEAFRFNPMGMDGYEAQIRQLVYTATEFPTIDRVQILLDGQVNDYLGAEGIFIGEPLGRGDLPQG